MHALQALYWVMHLFYSTYMDDDDDDDVQYSILMGLEFNGLLIWRVFTQGSTNINLADI